MMSNVDKYDLAKLTLLLLLSGSLGGSGSTAGGSGASAGDGRASGANVGQEVLDILALESL